MTDEAKKSPEQNGDDLESPAGGPTPDWMKLATSASSSGPSLTEENTPAWLKSIRAGKGLSKEPPPKAAPEPPPPPAPSSSDTMSDLERLLAEEGIDLSSVAEERPQDASGMSARDWLISTSSDELIRNKLGAEPLPEPEPAPLPIPSRASLDDDKMVVEEDLPDWLQEIAMDVSEPETYGGLENPIAIEPEDDQLVVLEELPDWLQDIASESETPVDVESTWPELTEPLLATSGKVVIEEGLPDWLQEVSEEPASAEVTPLDVVAPPSVMAVPASEDKMVIEEDLPDWLREVAAEETMTEAASVELAAPPVPLDEDKMVVQEDLPDWLRDYAEESLPAAAEPPWPASSATPPASALSMAHDSVIIEEELPDWLRDVEASAPAPDLILDDLGVDSATTMLDTDVNEADLPDWLREVEASNLAEPLQPAMPDLTGEALPAGEMAFSAKDELDLLDEEGLPDWLKEVQEQGGESWGQTTEPEVVTGPVASSSSDSGVIVEEDLPDWLREVEGESTLEKLPAMAELDTFDETGIGAEGLPDWLQEVEAVAEEAFEPSEPTPEPFTDAISAEGLVIEEELPDWLRETEAELPESPVELQAPAEVAALPEVPVSMGEMVASEELPDWLQEIEAESEQLPAVVEPLAAAELLVAPEPVAEIPTAEPVEEITEVVTPAVETPEVSPPLVKTPAITAPAGIPDWLQKLREVEPEPELVPMLAYPAPSAVPVMAAAAVVPPATPSPTAAARNLEIPADAAERLKKARTAREKGQFDQALPLYESLVLNGVYLDKIIDDMQQAVKSQPSNHLLYQLMGDAMMRDGRLQSALNAYRTAMAKL